MTLPPYKTVLTNRRGTLPSFRMVTFDPGETTGWACFKGEELDACGQITDNQADNFRAILDGYKPHIVVCEDYRVYAHKINANINSQIIPARLIGQIELICLDRGIPVVLQMASQAKGFTTDTKLKEWGLWQRGLRHSRDAIRHGIYFLFHGQFSLVLKEPIDATMQTELQSIAL